MRAICYRGGNIPPEWAAGTLVGARRETVPENAISYFYYR